MERGQFDARTKRIREREHNRAGQAVQFVFEVPGGVQGFAIGLRLHLFASNGQDDVGVRETLARRSQEITGLFYYVLRCKERVNRRGGINNLIIRRNSSTLEAEADRI